MGNIILAGASAAGQSKSSGTSITLLFIIVIFIFFYLAILRPQRRRQRQVMQVQREIVPGSRVRTTAGMYATVTAIDDQDVTLEVAPGVEVRFLRRAILDVVSDGSEPGFAGSPPAETASPDGLAAKDGATGDTATTEAGTKSDASGTESAEDERSAP